MDITLIIIIVVVVVWVQVTFFLKTLVSIRIVRYLYPSANILSVVEEKGTQTISTNNIKVQKEFASIIDSTNSYLIENQGTVDFHVIQNLSEGVSCSKESEASSGISIPLYIGLIGTFIGVAIGLFSLNIIGLYSEQGINYFLWGVVVAMLTSFVGLLLSTIAYSRLSYAVKCRDNAKNKYYSFIQAKLLPGMGNNIIDALGRLKGTLDNFNTVFADNIGNINNVVVNLAENLQTIAEGIGTQKEVLNQLYSSKYQELIKANNELFNRAEQIIPSMDGFIQKQKNLNDLMAGSAQFVTDVHKLLDRVSTFEESINGLGETLNEKQLLGSRQLNLVQRHLDDLDQKQSLIENYTNMSNEIVEEYLRTNLKNVRSLVDNFETAIRNAFEITTQDSPFQKLSSLDLIPKEIKKLNETLSLYADKEDSLLNLLGSISEDLKLLREETIYPVDFNKEEAEE